MKTPEQSAPTDQPSAPALSEFFDDRPGDALRCAESYDFFGDSHFQASDL
jgi:hypothetical protein